MAQNLFKRFTISLLLMSFLAACGNVRFSASPSTDGTGTTSGVPGNDTNNPGPGGGNNNTPGDDGAIPGGGNNTTNPTPTPTPPPSGNRDVNYSLQVAPAKNQVDFLLVIDNSASMIAVQQRMAAAMGSLASKMNALNIDWQMCWTVTTDMNQGGAPVNDGGTHTCTGPYCTGTYSGGTWYWGVSLPWSNGSYILNKAGLSADSSIFTNSIPKVGTGDKGTGDERGVKAAYNHFANWKAGGVRNTQGCYRAGSAVAVILLSDEDERSVAGDCSRVNTALGDKEIPACREYGTGALRVLEFQDQPTNLVSQANAVFGDSTRFTFNSIIADTDACQNQLNQNASFTINGIQYFSPHYTGTVYRQASQLTNGGIASLCSSNLDLNLFSDVSVNTLSKLSLECAPTSITVRTGADKASAEAAAPMDSSKYSVSGAVINFSPALQQNVWVNLQYHCAQ